MRCFQTILLVSVVILSLFVGGCYPALKKEAGQPREVPQESLRQVRSSLPQFQDDMEGSSLILAIQRNIEYLDRLPGETVFHYGPDDFTLGQVRESQEAFLRLLLRTPDAKALGREVRKRFRVYQATGQAGSGRVLFTGYYEPVCKASLTPDETFRYPLYRLPEDLLRIDLSLFNDKFRGETIVARIEGNEVLPYYTRSEIETGRVLEGKGLEIAWLKDPLDVSFLHIQGSGRLRLPDDEELLVNYQGSNGRRYRSIGQYMIEKGFLRQEEVSMQAIRNYLKELQVVLDEVLNYNPSYVFFREVENGPLGSLGVILTPGRSVALDARVFPKAALGFISTQKPVVNDRGEITGWTTLSRFVLNQDSGGAIKGAGRADLFWGSGAYAEAAAGHLRHDGDVYILIKKP